MDIYVNFDKVKQKEVGRSTILVNYIFQKILSINRRIPFMVHYTTRINAANGIKIINSTSNRSAYVCFASSNGCYMQALNGIEIDSSAMFASGVKIISANHDFLDREKHIFCNPIKIKQNVWIGANAIILPGVEIGENSIVGAGAVVTKSFPSNVIIVGNPARVLKNL